MGGTERATVGGGITNVTGGQGAKTDDGRQGDDAVADNRSITGAPHGAGGLADWGTQHELWTGVAWLVVIPSGFVVVVGSGREISAQHTTVRLRLTP